MEKLNELVEQAKFVADWHGSDWSSALCQGRDGKQAHEIICESRGEAVISTGSNSNEASWLCDYLELCSPANILAIAEAFRAMEKREKEAEAKLKELEGQEPAAWLVLSSSGGYVERNPEVIAFLEAAGLTKCKPLFTRPAPAVSLVEGLHPSTANLVISFADALAKKLRRSEEKYGWSDGWKDADWQEKCLADFHQHIGKGDPIDVAAYCAFMWHHEWPTRPASAVSLAELVPDEKPTDIPFAGHRIEAIGWNACRAAILRNIEEAK